MSVSACGRGRPRTQARMRAGTPAHSGGSCASGVHISPVSVCRRGRPRTQAALSLPSPQAGGDARAPRLACGRGRPPTQADRAHPACTFHQSPHAGGDARAPRRRSVCRLRKRAGTPAHPGRIWFNHSAHRSKCSISMSPTARGVYRIKFSIFISPTASSPVGCRVSAIPLPSSKLSYRLSAIGYSSAQQQALLSAIGYRLFLCPAARGAYRMNAPYLVDLM
jgi:hypothetical protein